VLGLYRQLKWLVNMCGEPFGYLTPKGP
jgi:hypothetical protein